MNLTFFQHVYAVRDQPRKMDILLGQQNRQTLFLQCENCVGHLLDDQGRHAFRRLVEQYKQRIAHQRASDGQHLLLTPAHPPPEAIRHFSEIGKQLEQLLRRPRGSGCAIGKATRGLATNVEIFHHSQIDENAAVFRSKAKSTTRNFKRFFQRNILATESHRASAQGHQAHDRFHGRGLAGAIATHQRDHFASTNLEAEVIQDARSAVPGAQAFNRKHRFAHCTAPAKVFPVPKYTSRTCALWRIVAASPSAIRRPLANTMMRSAKANTTSMECSVNRTEIPRSTTSRLTRAINSLRSRGAIPAVGSSINKRRGSLARAIASSTRLMSP